MVKIQLKEIKPTMLNTKCPNCKADIRSLVAKTKKDKFYKWNDWVIIRIPENKFFKNPIFWKHLIHEVVEERRKQMFKIRDEVIEPD